jgi:2-oxo-4-hydroxy-4-carboxy-5-ureidoimidazoline decarboxylase
VSIAEFPPAQAETLLLGCCASRLWAGQVVSAWPYGSLEELFAAAEDAFDGLDREDWLEAFAGHARIGQPRPGDERGALEQAGVRTATGDERAELAALNAEYDRRFGHVFLICATGLDTTQMRAALRERLHNSAQAEFDTATGEQRKITRLRLRATFGP